MQFFMCYLCHLFIRQLFYAFLRNIFPYGGCHAAGDTAAVYVKGQLSAVCQHCGSFHQYRVELYSDSAYVVNAIKLGWLENWKKNNWLGSDKKQVKNIEYWKRLDQLMNIHNVNFNKVKGHSDNEYNNRCDELATGEIAAHANDI